MVAWGNRDHGGDCSAVQDQLRNVQQIQATRFAFAAILADGSLVAWGDPDNGLHDLSHVYFVFTVLQSKNIKHRV